MTFDLDLWPTDLKINRDHLLTKDFLPTKFEASGAKRSWVISCTRWSKLAWPLTLTFDLLTWKSIGIIYSPRTIYLPSLKLLGQSVIELSVAQGFRDTDIQTDRPTDRCKAISPPFSKGGIKSCQQTKSVTDGRTDRQTDRQTDGQTDRRTTDKVTTKWRFACFTGTTKMYFIFIIDSRLVRINMWILGLQVHVNV